MILRKMLFAIVASTTVLMVLGESTAVAEKAHKNLPDSNYRKVEIKQPPSEIKKKETKKLVDLRLDYVAVEPTNPAGPTIWILMDNWGPHTAYDFKMCVNPGRDGTEQCKTGIKLGPRKETDFAFQVKGGTRVTISVVKGPRNTEKNLANNICAVNVLKPKNELKNRTRGETYSVSCKR